MESRKIKNLKIFLPPVHWVAKIYGLQIRVWGKKSIPFTRSFAFCIWWNMIQLQYSTVPYSTVKYSAVKYSTVQLQYSTVTVQYSYSTVQLQYSTVTVRYCTVLYSTVTNVEFRVTIYSIKKEKNKFHLFPGYQCINSIFRIISECFDKF